MKMIDLPDLGFDKIMPTRRVASEDEIPALTEQMLKEGFRLAAISNTGLLGTELRVTFLPESAFLKPGEKQKPMPRKMDVRDLVKFMDEGHDSDVASEMARDKFQKENPDYIYDPNSL